MPRMREFAGSASMAGLFLLVLFLLGSGCSDDDGVKPQPICESDPDTLFFGGVAVGDSRELSFIIRNAGNGTLEGTVRETCEAFAIVADSVFSLEAGETQTVRIRFLPVAGGDQSCRLQVGAGEDHVWALGSGQPDIVRPAPTHLEVTGAGASSVSLSWTAVGDDSLSGTAAEYDLRHSTAPITEGNWSAADPVTGEPAPRPSGQSEAFTVTDLAPGAVHFFALKVRDEAVNWSALSNVVSEATQDVIRPAPLRDLEAGAATGTSILLSWTASGDDSLTGTAGTYDIRYSSDSGASWGQAERVVNEDPPAAAGEQESFRIGDLASDTEYFFWIRVADEVPNWSEIGGPVSAATLDITPPAAVRDLRVQSTSAGSMTLTWTAPGDNGETGTAASYDVRFATAPNTPWAGMSQATGEPVPAAAGTAEVFTVLGLSANTTYYFRLVAADEVPNRSDESNECSDEHDTTPPAAVTDLRTSAPTGSTLTLEWTAPGDDGTTGTASAYELRYATAADTPWESMSDGPPVPDPAPAGSDEQFVVTGLQSDRTYYFLLKTRDEVPNVSAPSNVAVGTTVDATSPAAVDDLECAAAAGAITLTWTATGDDADAGRASVYDVRWSTEAGAVWSDMTAVEGEPAPGSAGASETFTLTGLDPGTTFYVRIKVGDEVPNWSALSNVTSCSTPDTDPPDEIDDLAAISSTGTSVTLTWHAVGDDGETGTAHEYDVRYSTAAGTDWSLMTQATGEAAPKAAGQSETFTVSGLLSGTTYYFQIRTADEADNWSGLSNAAFRATLDITPPVAVVLAGAPASAQNAVLLTWIASGDDGTSGTASHYDVRYAVSAGTAWESMTQAPGEPAPKAPGEPETFTVTGLNPTQQYYFCIKVGDEVPNWSVESNRVAVTPDNIRPARVSDLRVGATSAGSITLLWTAVGDDSLSGTAAAYDVRYSAAAITEANFGAAAPVPDVGPPKASGQAETLLVAGLPTGTEFHFRLLVRDDAGNSSALSNDTTGSTVDAIRPAPVHDLKAGATTDDRVLLTWTATGDDSLTGRAATYVLRYSPVAGAEWEAMINVSGEPVPAEPGELERFAVTGLDPENTYYFRLVVRDDWPNTSAESNEADGTTAPEGMAFVPAGIVRLGQPGLEYMVHEVEVDSFFIDLREVTTAEYKEFMDHGGYTTEALWDSVGWAWKSAEGITAPDGWDGSALEDHYLHNDPDAYGIFPVQGVSWWEARAYARWAGKRLPTEAEWEMAAKGGCAMWGDPDLCDGEDTPTYPWGDGSEWGRANYSRSGDPYDDSGRTTPVGYYDGTLQGGYQTVLSPGPYGCFDMAGNVWEWCSSGYGSYPYYGNDGREEPPEVFDEPGRVIRGGSWYDHPDLLRCSYRDAATPDKRNERYGFRCVKD